MNKSPRVKIIMLTSTISTQQIIEALQIGARGIVLKDAVAGDLSKSLRAVLSGDYWIGWRACRQPGHSAQRFDERRPLQFPSARPTVSRRANLRSLPASLKAAVTRTSPSSSPSAKRQLSAICRTSSTRLASLLAWNSHSLRLPINS